MLRFWPVPPPYFPDLKSEFLSFSLWSSEASTGIASQTDSFITVRAVKIELGIQQICVPFQLFVVAYIFFSITFILAEVFYRISSNFTNEKKNLFNKSGTCLMSLAHLVIPVNTALNKCDSEFPTYSQVLPMLLVRGLHLEYRRCRQWLQSLAHASVGYFSLWNTGLPPPKSNHSLNRWPFLGCIPADSTLKSKRTFSTNRPMMFFMGCELNIRWFL